MNNLKLFFSLKFKSIFNLFFARREKRDIPFILSACIREVERRGMYEVGIYRVSGSASDLAKLKKSFETSLYLKKIFKNYYS